jgi:hypothetical protein
LVNKRWIRHTAPVVHHEKDRRGLRGEKSLTRPLRLLQRLQQPMAGLPNL